ncbi:kinase-like domain-containing protein [Glomus cerebriforme]|uniref:Kinase-like domain-containing protein n=1 Tax=Glomus cerebriforme TaxID=658196 RepID=A0A397SB01_9GLOM|nr:kinase-like domain-containing protein [Glomus cerebriforme]
MGWGTSYCDEKVLEWIPYDRFYDIKYIAKGGFGKAYRTNWIDGYIIYWDNKIQNWVRPLPNMFVALKSLYNSKDITLEFINETLWNNSRPRNKKLYYDKNYNELSWKTKFRYLWYIAIGLENIHDKELIHRDLHIGNIFRSDVPCITDMGLCKPADYNTLENTTKRVYVPQLIVHLIKRCLDANPLNRPTTEEIRDILWQWWESLQIDISQLKINVNTDRIKNNTLEEAKQVASLIRSQHNLIYFELFDTHQDELRFIECIYRAAWRMNEIDYEKRNDYEEGLWLSNLKLLKVDYINKY